MTQTITVTATQARQNLYQLIDQVVRENKTVRIFKKNLSSPVIITKAINKPASTKSQRHLVLKTAGAIKTTGYKPNDMELAAKIFVKEYKEKYG